MCLGTKSHGGELKGYVGGRRVCMCTKGHGGGEVCGWTDDVYRSANMITL